MALGLVLPALLVLATLVARPLWPHSRRWGYFPAAILFATVIVLSGLILLEWSG